MTERDCSSLLLTAVDVYFDRAPRPDADVVETGVFTLFVSRTPWSYYARPALSHSRAITGADLRELAAVCKESHVDLAIEWVDELHPELAKLAPTLGLVVTQHALMTLNAGQPVPATTDDAVTRIIAAEEPALLPAQAVVEVSFRAGGTSTGPAGRGRSRLRRARLGAGIDCAPARSGPSTTHDHRRG